MIVPTFIVFLTIWVPNMEFPTLVFIRSHETMHECEEFKENNIAVDRRNLYKCIKMEVMPNKNDGGVKL